MCIILKFSPWMYIYHKGLIGVDFLSYLFINYVEQMKHSANSNNSVERIFLYKTTDHNSPFCLINYIQVKKSLLWIFCIFLIGNPITTVSAGIKNYCDDFLCICLFFLRHTNKSLGLNQLVQFNFWTLLVSLFSI